MDYTLRPVKKAFFYGTHRSRQPEETDASVEPLIPDIGVVDLADLTGLDRLGIPVYSCARPNSPRLAATIYYGKGLTPVQAKVSTLMEALERFSAEYRGDPMVFAGYQEIGITRAVDPDSLILPTPLPLGERLHWTEGWDLLNEEPVMVPSNAVYHPYDTQGMTKPLFRSDATGLAAGNEPEEAILYGLLEVVEWDALSIATREKSMGRRLSAEESPEIRRLLDRYSSAGIDIHLWLLAGRTGIPTVAAAADDTETKNPALLVMGVGTHTDPEIATINALLEVAEGRAVQLSGDAADENRDSLMQRIGYDRMKRVNREWFAPAKEIELGAVARLSTPTFGGDIAAVLEEIKGHTDRVCLCDLTRTEIPVVRCVVPGFEVSHSDPDRVRRSRGSSL